MRVDDPLNAHLIPHRAERTAMLDNTLGIMKSCTQILDNLAAIEEALDEMNAADRSNFKRDSEL